MFIICIDWIIIIIIINGRDIMKMKNINEKNTQNK